jgi:hypothetical protein
MHRVRPGTAAPTPRMLAWERLTCVCCRLDSRGRLGLALERGPDGAARAVVAPIRERRHLRGCESVDQAMGASCSVSVLSTGVAGVKPRREIIIDSLGTPRESKTMTEATMTVVPPRPAWRCWWERTEEIGVPGVPARPAAFEWMPGGSFHCSQALATRDRNSPVRNSARQLRTWSSSRGRIREYLEQFRIAGVSDPYFGCWRPTPRCASSPQARHGLHR